MEEQDSSHSVQQFQRAQICQGGKEELICWNAMIAPIFPTHAATC